MSKKSMSKKGHSSNLIVNKGGISMGSLPINTTFSKREIRITPDGEISILESNLNLLSLFSQLFDMLFKIINWLLIHIYFRMPTI